MKPLFLLMFSAIPFLSSAQGKIRYSYDMSGNRIERVIVMPKAKSSACFTSKCLCKILTELNPEYSRVSGKLRSIYYK